LLAGDVRACSDGCTPRSPCAMDDAAGASGRLRAQQVYGDPVAICGRESARAALRADVGRLGARRHGEPPAHPPRLARGRDVPVRPGAACERVAPRTHWLHAGVLARVVMGTGRRSMTDMGERADGGGAGTGRIAAGSALDGGEVRWVSLRCGGWTTARGPDARGPGPAGGASVLPP